MPMGSIMAPYKNSSGYAPSGAEGRPEALPAAQTLHPKTKPPAVKRWKCLVFPIDLRLKSDRWVSLPAHEALPTKFVMVLTDRDNCKKEENSGVRQLSLA